ncbi:MAG: FtsX-like permease family protein [Deltaproteobacteria bacterium]|nr:FtsX-like permease family protein [Deltaproteobacteria bacterium]
MLRLLRLLTLRHCQRHRLRTSLTFFGIVLGVAVIVAIAIVNRSLIGSFERTIDLLAGKAVLQVTNAESGVSESLFPAIRDTEGVKDAAAVVEGFVPVVGVQAERLFVYGIDFLTDFTIRKHEFVGAGLDLESALDFIARPDSIALTQSFAARHGFSPGSEIVLATSEGARRYTVRALLRDQGTARVFGGNFALMDLPVAQITFGKEKKLDSIDLTIQEGENVEAVKRRLAARLGGAARVERPQERGEQIELLLSSFRIGLLFVSLIALFVGFFLIYNTVSVSVFQRKREIGTLRCLGIRRREILVLFVLEALAIALPGSLLGIVAGIALAQGALLFVGETVRNLFLWLDLARSPLTAREFWAAVASGLGVSVVAALHPAWEATQVSPQEGARQAAWSPRFAGLYSRATIAGVGLLTASPFLIFFPPPALGAVGRFSLGMGAMLIFLLGLSFLSPLTVLSCARVLRWSLAHAPWLEGRIAADSLRRSPVRSGITVATLMISLSAIFTIATFVHSVRGSLLAWIDQMVTADLVVHSGARTAGPKNVPLKEDLADHFRRIPGVELVDLYRLIRSTYQGKPIVIESFSAQVSEKVRKLPVIGGDAKVALARMAAGEGVVVSESFQSKFGKGRGDVIRLPTPSGLTDFLIVDVYVDYSSDSGSVLLDRSLYKKHWGDALVDAFDLWLARGTDQQAVIDTIKRDYGEKYQLFVSTHRELRDTVVEIMEQSFSVNYAVEVVAMVVAIFSVINTLLASILDRTREIGVLRAIGTTRKQLSTMVLAEAGWLGLIGGLLGLLSGTVMSYHHVVYNTKVLTGWTFQYHYPYGVAIFSLLLAVALCLAAGYVPARQAAQAPIVGAIGYE